MFYEQCKYELETYKRKVKSVNEVLKTLSEKCIAADREATAKREAASLKREGANSTKGRLDEMLGGEIKSVGEAAEIIRAVGDPDGARRRIAKAEAELTALKDRAKQLDGQMLLFGGKCENTDELRLELAKEKEKLNFLSENLGKNKKNASDLSQNFEKRCIIEKDIEKETAKATMFGKLYEAGKDKKFIEFVAAEFLSDIAESARKTLLELSGGKYDVTYVDGLDGKDGFFVVDNLNGGVRRSVSSLSGGETFLVSLSLALSLSSEIYRKSKRPMEFFFLDEGFGTLDGDLVDTVIGSLFKLRNDNFTIGLISHLQEMKNRIEAQIIVCAANQTKGSSVKTVAP
ncbi:MAG: hypothetical protein IJS67_02075, partial [Clostridia bacterium]|nr:hypothetical protein [Clostridia bacterium]